MTKTAISKAITDHLRALVEEGATVAQLASVVQGIASNDAGWARLGPAKAKTRKGVRKAGAR